MNPQQTGHMVASTVGGKTTSAPKVAPTNYHSSVSAFGRMKNAVVNRASNYLANVVYGKDVSDSEAAVNNKFADEKLMAKKQLAGSKASIGRNYK